MKNIPKSIRIDHLLGVIISFLLGAWTTLLILNISNQEESIVFSTLDLLGFVLSILFGGAGIVLAMVAINLGKSSEIAMINRNDASMKMQSDVFTKTIEALSEIKSSTGTTEKRIEDIIAGRIKLAADDISQSKVRSRDNVEKILKKSFSTSSDEELKKRRQARTRYKALHESILRSLVNAPDINSEKPIGHGGFDEEGIDLFDAVISVRNKKAGVSIFSSEEILSEEYISTFEEYITRVSREISKGTINFFFYVSDKESDTSRRLNEMVAELAKVFKIDIQDKIIILAGENDALVKSISELLK